MCLFRKNLLLNVRNAINANLRNTTLVQWKKRLPCKEHGFYFFDPVLQCSCCFGQMICVCLWRRTVFPSPPSCRCGRRCGQSRQHSSRKEEASSSCLTCFVLLLQAGRSCSQPAKLHEVLLVFEAAVFSLLHREGSSPEKVVHLYCVLQAFISYKAFYQFVLDCKEPSEHRNHSA